MKSATERVLIMVTTSHEWVKDRDPAKTPLAVVAAIQADAARAQRESDANWADLWARPTECQILYNELVTDKPRGEG